MKLLQGNQIKITNWWGRNNIFDRRRSKNYEYYKEDSTRRVIVDEITASGT